MYAPAKLMTLRELLLCELFLLLIPMAAYPIREIFHIGKDRRKGQRSTALVCSAIGDLCGFLWSILTPCSWLVHILFLSYVISIAALLILNAVFRLHASGHACSTTAPVFLLTWKLHPLFIIPSVLLIAAVYRSSLKLSRHYPAAAPYWLGSQSARLWYFTADLRTRLIVMQPNNQKMRCTTIAQCGMAHFLCNYSQSCFFGSPNRRIIWILHQPDLIRVGSKHGDGI